jgi:hypothetical protein
VYEDRPSCHDGAAGTRLFSPFPEHSSCVEKNALGPLNPVFGRFGLEGRINKDEVPVPFGSSGREVNETTLKVTHVMFPNGFGDCIATLDMAVSGAGYLLDALLIFKGSGKQVETYDADGVVVHWQTKAWKDGKGELLWYRRVLLPYKQSMEVMLGVKLPEMMIQHDNVRMHHDYNTL